MDTALLSDIRSGRFDWSADDAPPVALPPPHVPPEELDVILAAARQDGGLAGHVAIATSGSRARKWAFLSRRAILASAAAVNRHLASDSRDTWLLALPLFHVGGLGIPARAFLSGARVAALDGKWDPSRFVDAAASEKATLASLVPTQLHDLVAAALPAPRGLRAVVLGGAALSGPLRERALALGWPVLGSYGLTECASQVATARPGRRELILLDHVEAAVGPDGLLHLRSAALLTAYVHSDGRIERPLDPLGWLCTGDRARLDDRVLVPLGRADEHVKVGGETVDLARLNARLEALLGEAGAATSACLVAFPDARLGSVVSLVYERAREAEALAAAARFDAGALPFERIRARRPVEELPRSPLGKILRSQLSLIGSKEDPTCFPHSPTT